MECALSADPNLQFHSLLVNRDRAEALQQYTKEKTKTRQACTQAKVSTPSSQTTSEVELAALQQWMVDPFCIWSCAPIVRQSHYSPACFCGPAMGRVFVGATDEINANGADVAVGEIIILNGFNTQ